MEIANSVLNVNAYDPEAANTPILVVGDLERWKELGHEPPVIEGYVFVDFEDVTLYALESIRPQVVLSPLLGRNFDAIEIARRLQAMGYKGRYRVITDGVPDPMVVDNDVRAVAPTLDFSVMTFPANSNNR